MYATWFDFQRTTDHEVKKEAFNWKRPESGEGRSDLMVFSTPGSRNQTLFLRCEALSVEAYGPMLFQYGARQLYCKVNSK